MLFWHADGDRYQDNQLADLCDHLESCSVKWREIGMHVGFKQKELDHIQCQLLLFMEAPNSWLKEMLSQWIKWNDNDLHGSNGYATKEALRYALRKASNS